MLKTLNSRKHFSFDFCNTLRHIFDKCVIAGLKIRRLLNFSVKRSQRTNVEVVFNNKSGAKHRHDDPIFIQRTQWRFSPILLTLGFCRLILCPLVVL